MGEVSLRTRQWRDRTGGDTRRRASSIKHTTTLFSLSDHYILSREWRVIVDQVQTSYHGVTELLFMRDPHNGGMCFNGRMCLNPRSSTFLAVEKVSASAFSVAKNVELLGFYPI